jgi:hypothetical protein
MRSPTAGQRALLQIQQGPDAETNEEGLHRVDIPLEQGILFVKAPRPQLGRFDRISLDPIYLEYAPGSLPWSEPTRDRLRRSFVRALTNRLEKQRTWKLIEPYQFGPGILTMRITAKDLTVSDENELPHVRATHFSDGPGRGKTTLVLELFDSETDEMLVQFIQGRTIPAIPDEFGQVDNLRIVFSQFANSMGDSLAQLAQAVEDVRKDDESATTPTTTPTAVSAPPPK